MCYNSAIISFYHTIDKNKNTIKGRASVNVKNGKMMMEREIENVSILLEQSLDVSCSYFSYSSTDQTSSITSNCIPKHLKRNHTHRGCDVLVRGLMLTAWVKGFLPQKIGLEKVT